MALSEFRRRERLSQARLAEMLTFAGYPATQTLISQWESGDVAIPAERCAQLERVTGGKLTRLQLRPDLFGDLEQQPDDAPGANADTPLPQRNDSNDGPHGAAPCPNAPVRA